MRITILFIAMVFMVRAAKASESIIDPELMNQETWAQPYFPSEQEILAQLAAEEVARSANGDEARVPASEPAGVELAVNEAPVKNADEFLDVLKSIPTSEPSISRAWLEYKILHEED